MPQKSSNLKNLNNNLAFVIFRKLVILTAVLIIGLAAGYTLQSRAQSAKSDQIASLGEIYVNHILHNNLDAAYNMSSEKLHKVQTKEVFASTLKGLQSDKSTLSDEEIAFSNKGISYAVVADNLPANSEGATEAVITVHFTHEADTWKVYSVDIN